MNNSFTCECWDGENVFFISVPDIIDEDPNSVIGDVIWCGECDGHSYDVRGDCCEPATASTKPKTFCVSGDSGQIATGSPQIDATAV